MSMPEKDRERFTNQRGKIVSKHLRRRLLQWAAVAVFAAMPLAAHAETYPSHPARIIVGFPAGGPQDITARLIAQWLSEHLGQQFLVESRAGAGGTLGAEYVVNSPRTATRCCFAARRTPSASRSTTS